MTIHGSHTAFVQFI